MLGNIPTVLDWAICAPSFSLILSHAQCSLALSIVLAFWLYAASIIYLLREKNNVLNLKGSKGRGKRPLLTVRHSIDIVSRS